VPEINEYKCNKCGFELPEGWGYYFYVENDKGGRIGCCHPGEISYVEKVLGEYPPLELIQERTGFNSLCVCLDCLYQFEADLGGFSGYWCPYMIDKVYRPKQGKDKRECPKCKSKRVKTELEMVGEPCPKCKEGIIEEIFTGAMS
jgi:predicted RNA-binding Zn-ribbon protein involved in translation (DUF1610 family)